ncbi:MAG: fibronectin type III domain-containing protein [Chloracidobacterium sp.]|nr:fibronectin type III domain-containing protein [Chloracidobacterium sp.]MDW8217190.1 fibronectin type III domain-containing protein [Acidobacteriota bacterium]
MQLGLVWSGLAAVVGGFGCAKVGPPVPPPRFTLAAAGDLTVTQYGEQIVLRFTRPARAVRAEVLRRVEPRDAPPALPEDVFLREARLIGFLDEAALAAAVSVTYTDRFDPQDAGWSGRRIRYAVRLVDAQGRPSPLSSYAVVYPAAAVAQPPDELRAEVTQDAVRLTWRPPTSNLDGSPAADVQFNVYRRRTDGGVLSRRNDVPLTAPTFADTDFVFGETYEYVVRAVSLVRGELIESQDTPPLQVRPVDTFPPAAPTNVTGASAAGLVNLFFPANTETDLRGYLIYRSEVESEPGKASPPIKLTPTPIQRTTFQDRTGIGGKLYRYFVTAVDIFGNESAPSNSVEVEVVP